MKKVNQGCTKFIRASVVAGCFAGSLGTAFAAPIDLNSVGYVLYGDGESYSLPFAIIDHCDGKAAGCQYSVDSTAGQIKDLIVVATGASGTGVETNSSGMDNAYSTPSGVNGSIFFQPTTDTSNGTTGTVVNNGSTTWDASLSAMKIFLDGNQMVTFFNNNQTNSGGAATESLAGWIQVWITDDSNNIIGDVYQLTNDHGQYKLFTEGGGGIPLGDAGDFTNTAVGDPFAGTNAETDYVLSGGMICRSAGLPVPCSETHDEEVAHNLGADHAAYAILFPELNALMSSLFASLSDTDLANYTLHFDVRLGCDPSITSTNITTICKGDDPNVPYGRSLNNGYEQIFIGTAARFIEVPEPGSLALMGLGLGIFGWRMRRRTTG